MLQLKLASGKFAGSENVKRARQGKSHVENVIELQTSHLGLPHSRRRRNLNFEKLKFFCKDKA